MSFFIGRNHEARRSYSFDEVSIVPGSLTINPEIVDTSSGVGDIKMGIPFLASAMDAVTNPAFAVLMSKFGGLGVLNLDGIYTRYPKPEEPLSKIIRATPEKVTRVMQEVYSRPVQEKLISQRIAEIKEKGAVAAVSTIPQNAHRIGSVAQEAGADILVIQATVVTSRHESANGTYLDLKDFCKGSRLPVIVGNCVTAEAASELMETGCAGILIGVGPGSACTSRQVLGVGVPQVTAIVDAADARDVFYKKTGRYVALIADGGMRTGGDICKAMVAGADFVMLGGTFARAKEAPGQGYHWGMAMPSKYLPRGTRVKVGREAPLEQILTGPAFKDDGTQNLVGALRTTMGYVGAKTIHELQQAELIIAPQIGNEGKLLQKMQGVGSV
ncbi:MAG: GuaB3 family IMP dehydrogenase-related protein [Elusimicrobia bacterium]|nr:GuaB3 family IMP dehydrogenase-related protein [Elusimicrobiota bacterium]